MQTSISRFTRPDVNWYAKALARMLTPALLVAMTVGNAYAVTYAYIPDEGNGTVSVINTTTQTQTTVLTGFGTPYSAAVAPNGSVAYVADFGGNRIIPINTTTNVAGTPITVGTSPVNVTFTPDSVSAYVSNYNANSISVINVASGTVTTTVATVCPAGSANPIQSIFYGVKLLIVCNGPTSRVISMDTSAGNALTTLATAGNTAYNIAISTVSGFGYVSNYGGGNVTKFDLNTGAATTYPTTGVNSPLSLAVSLDGSKIFIADYGGNNLIVMNPTGTILATLNLGGSTAGIGRSSNGAVLYVPLRGLGAGIKVIDPTTNAVTGTIANPGANPQVIWGDFLGNVVAAALPSTGGGSAAAVPALSGWGLAGLSVLLLIFGIRQARGQKISNV